MKTTLIIPTLNELGGMKEIMPRIQREWLHQILIVDGGSTDGTLDYVRENGYDLYQQKQRGLRMAYEEVYEKVQGDSIILFSPDGNCIPELIPDLIKKMEEGYDMVIASRYLGNAKSDDDDALTGFGNWMFTFLINTLFGGRYTDSLNIFRAFKKNMVQDLGIYKDIAPLVRWGLANGIHLSWEVQLSIRCAKRKLKVGEIPGDEPARLSGRRKMQPFSAGAVMLAEIFREKFLCK